MSKSTKVEHNGVSYTWTGNSWIETKTFLRPPEIIIRELNRKAASQTIETDINTTDVDEILQRASNAREDGHMGQAEWLSRRALQLEPGNPGALAILCSVLRAQHQPARALRETDAYRHLSYPPLITSRAAAYCDIGEWTKAKAEIARVLAIGGGPTAFSVVHRIKQNRPELYK